MTPTAPHPRPSGHRRRRLAGEQGFTMIFALGTLLVTMLLVAAVTNAVLGETAFTRSDLNGKRAYAAAQSALQAYLYQVNNNSGTSQWWETCANDTLGSAGAPVSVPGSTTGASYSWAPVLANTATTCSTSDPIGSLIDTSTGVLRMKFTGYAGNAQRTIVASLRTLTPLSFLWYTVYETVDTSIGGNQCAAFYYDPTPPPSSCYIYWVSGDKMNGPMYTQDQFLIYPGGTPTFGRNQNDAIASQVTTNGTDDICAFSNCQGDPNILGHREPDVQDNEKQVLLPIDNSNLQTDAGKHGLVLAGTTTLNLTTVSGTPMAVGYNCPSSSSTGACTAENINLTTTPIIYATNASSGCSSTYNPTSVSYPTNNIGQYYGPCGDIYVHGSYTTPLTLAAANDVVVTDDITTTSNAAGTLTGPATLGLVANEYVRVMHPCSGGNPDTTIDAAILTLAHSFFVDNYNCGGSSLGKLTVNGAIAQMFRGVVGQIGNSGYLKNYNYDDRLSVILPPYLFDIQNTSWTVFRESLCSQTAPATSTKSCFYTGP
jgi:Tfp pilus assembly protein PilX